MNQKLQLLSLFLFLLLCTGKVSAQQKFIPFNHPSITYDGRVLYKADYAQLAWSGNSVSINFEGDNVRALLADSDTADYFHVILDGTVIGKIHPGKAKERITLADKLNWGSHHLQLFKCTEWDKGKARFYGFEISDKGKTLNPEPAKQRKIAFYGNSITCGYGVEDRSGKDSHLGYFENNYLTYAALTARHFNAQYHCISKSGIGILISWFPLIMPEMYDRTDPDDPESKWDFNAYQPDVIVINLLQNDSWLVKQPSHEQFKARFGTQEPSAATIIKAYKDFVFRIRSEHPGAFIICALGNMDITRAGSPWPGYVETVVKELNDSRITACFFPVKKGGGHPSVDEQEQMATQLIRFIEERVKW